MKNLLPANVCSKSAMFGMGKESGTVCRFKALKSIAHQTVPSFFMSEEALGIPSRGESKTLAEGVLQGSSGFLPVLG